MMGFLSWAKTFSLDHWLYTPENWQIMDQLARLKESGTTHTLIHPPVTHVQYRLAHRIFVRVTPHELRAFIGFPGKRYNFHRVYPMREHLTGQVAEFAHPQVSDRILPRKLKQIVENANITAGVGNRSLPELLHVLHLQLLAIW